MTNIAQFMATRCWMPGTVLMIPSEVPPFSHFAMVEFIDFHTGVEWAIHNMPGIGVARAPLYDMIGSKPVVVGWKSRTPEEGEDDCFENARPDWSSVRPN